MNSSTLKLLVGPTLLIVAVMTIYVVSIDLTAINRADVAFGLMSFLATLNAWIAFRWFQKGFATFEMMKQQEKVASDIIEKLIKRFSKDGDHQSVVETILSDQLSSVVKDLTKIIDKHKS